MIFLTSISVDKILSNTDSFYLAMSGDSLDEIVNPEMKQAYEADKKNWLQQTNLAREHLDYLGLNLQAQGGCGLLQSATLFKTKLKSAKTNIAVKVFREA